MLRIHVIAFMLAVKVKLIKNDQIAGNTWKSEERLLVSF